MIKSNAKLNLSLKIVGQRADKYHLLETIFVPLYDLDDEITIQAKSDNLAHIELISNLNFAQEENLIYKSMIKYCEKFNIKDSFVVNLKKNLPLNSGLGAGSSNASFALQFLNQKYKKLTSIELNEFAAKIGADVPFFLCNKLANVTGIGEKIREINSSCNLYFVLLNPNFPISTPWAFKKYDESITTLIAKRDNSQLEKALKIGNFIDICKNIENDFSLILHEKFSIYDIFEEFFIKNGADKFSISGSGSTCFAICENIEKQERLYQALKNEYQNENFWIKKANYIL